MMNRNDRRQEEVKTQKGKRPFMVIREETKGRVSVKRRDERGC